MSEKIIGRPVAEETVVFSRDRNGKHRMVYGRHEAASGGCQLSGRGNEYVQAGGSGWMDCWLIGREYACLKAGVWKLEG